MSTPSFQPAITTKSMANHLQLKATFYTFLLGHVSRHALVKMYKILPPSVAVDHRFGNNRGFDGDEEFIPVIAS
jgi:hypothetical protein